MMGATRATTTIGTTIAGMSVLSGMALEDEEGVCVGTVVSAGASGESKLNVATVPEDGPAVARGGGPSNVCVEVATASRVQVLSGLPLEPSWVLRMKEVTVVVYDEPSPNGSEVIPVSGGATSGGNVSNDDES